MVCCVVMQRLLGRVLLGLDADLLWRGEDEVESVEEGVVAEGEVAVGEGGEAWVVVEECGAVEAAFLPLGEGEGGGGGRGRAGFRALGGGGGGGAGRGGGGGGGGCRRR